MSVYDELMNETNRRPGRKQKGTGRRFGSRGPRVRWTTEDERRERRARAAQSEEPAQPEEKADPKVDEGLFQFLKKALAKRKARKAAKWTTQPSELFGGPDKTKDPVHQKKVVADLEAQRAKQKRMQQAAADQDKDPSDAGTDDPAKLADPGPPPAARPRRNGFKHSGNGNGMSISRDVSHTEYEGPSLLEQLAYVVEGASKDTERRSSIVKGKAKRAGPPLKAGEAVEDYKWNEAAGRWEHVTPGVAKAVEGWHVKNRANPWLPPKQQKPS